MGAKVTCFSTLFQTRIAATEKASSPTVDSRQSTAADCRSVLELRHRTYRRGVSRRGSRVCSVR